MDTSSRGIAWRVVAFVSSLTLAAAIWLSALPHLFDRESTPEGRARVAEALLARQLAGFEDPTLRARALSRMRSANAEWDFMGRTFFVLALSNRALERPEEAPRYLAVVDRILGETLGLEAELGQAHFLMDYATVRPFVDPSGRSVFVDGEIALMLASRQRVQPSARWREPLAERVALVSAQLARGPTLSAESYPDECWTFCNTLALAAIRVSDSVTGEDHGPLLHAWLDRARADLIDPATGLLVSSYHLDGRHRDGPEGSSLFLAAHMLSLVDPEFARAQYEGAARELGGSFAGFGWAREWPASWRGPPDIDSGPIVPIVDASAGASGMMLLGAAAFGDEARLQPLHRSLHLAAFPIREAEGMRFAASNQVGDAVLLYSLLEGPLFRAVGPAPRPASTTGALSELSGGGR